MRPLVLLAPLLLATLAGCFEAGTDPLPGGGGTPPGDASPPFLAFHASAQDDERTTWWVFAVRPNATAVRFQYVDDRSAAVRMGEGIDHPLEDVRLLLEPRGGNQNRSTGGVIVMLERGTVAPAAMERLRAAVADWPTTPGRGLDDPGTEDLVRFRAEGGVDVLRLPPARPEHRALLEAFRAAQEGFEVEEVFTSREAPHARPPSPDACPRMRVRVEPEAITPGETLVATATLENCGDEPLTVGQDACGPEPVWRLDVAARGRGRALPLDGEAGAARMHDPVCEGAPRPLTVAPGADATLVRRWNGTFLECDGAGACRHEEAAGEVSVLSYLSRQEYPAHANVLVVPRDGERTRLLLVKEHDWVNGTAEEPLRGDFGPHCAPVRYTLSPPTVTLRDFGGDGDLSVGPAIVVRDFRDGERPANVLTLSADRLDSAWADPTATLASPFDPDLPLALVQAEGEDFLVNGTRVGPGETFTLRWNGTMGAYEVASILVFRNVGSAATFTERLGGCM